jgi:PAS domain S-box-containing protein
MFNTLKSRLLFWFIIFSFLSVIVVIVINSAFFRSKEKVSYAISELSTLQIKFLLDFKSVAYYFSLDAINNDYYETKKSKYLDQHKLNIEKIKSEIKRLSELKTSSSLDINSMYHDIYPEMAEYETILSQLEGLILERGFKDNGVIGQMRDAAHMLETFPELNQTQVLSLRRHEKDYMLRNDSQYITKLRNLVNQMKIEIAQRADISGKKKNTIIILLDNYTLGFNKMVLLDERIGIRTSSGLKLLLDQHEQKLLGSLDKMLITANLSKDEIFREMEIYYAIYFVIIFLISIYMSILISNRVTSPLLMLTAHIQKLIASDFSLIEKPVIKKAHEEIDILYEEFHKMLVQLAIRDKQRSDAEKAFRLNELKYRHLADMLPQSVFETNAVGNFTYVNKTWLESFGYTLQDVNEGLNLIEVVKTDNINLVINGKEFNFREFIAVQKDGKTFPAIVYSNPRIVNRQVVGYTGIIIDNTERKNYTEALEKEKKKVEESDRLKSAFLSNMSHEIRTPMNSIIGFTDLLSREGINEKDHKEYLRYIRQSGDLLIHLIDDIIDFAKIEAGELSIRKQECNLNEMLDDLYVRFREVIREKVKPNLTLTLYKSIQTDGFNIVTDPYRLNQILTNLLSNAVKFTEEGSIEFGYELVSSTKMIFFVKDTGIGISNKDQKVIFERFRQVDGSISRKYGGTGLGLAITRHLTDLMGGKIRVESEPGTGSAFLVEMPLIKGISSNTALEKVMTNNLTFNWKGKKILIAEDDSANFTFINAVLKPTAALIIHARNGQEAVSLVEKYSDIDLVLMDMQMPVLSGYDASSKIKKIRPELIIIAQTAYALAGEKEKTLKAGCDDYISKPLNINLLLSKISRCFRKTGSAYIEPDSVHKDVII